MVFTTFLFPLGKNAQNTLDVDSHSLFQVIKDHKSESNITMAETSYVYAVRKAARRKGITIPKVVNLEKPEHVINIFIKEKLPIKIRRELKEGLENIKFTKLRAKLFEEEPDISEFVFQ